MMVRIIALVLVLVAMVIVYATHVAHPSDPRRDPRCDTPARYEAMREGANCS